jgi:hypothetical protein
MPAFVRLGKSIVNCNHIVLITFYPAASGDWAAVTLTGACSSIRLDGEEARLAWSWFNSYASSDLVEDVPF